MFGTSRKTVSRRIKLFNLRGEVPKYSDISDDYLNDFVKSTLHNFPNCGIRRMKGFLLGEGIHVTWERVRSSLWRTDPTGILLRTIQLNHPFHRKWAHSHLQNRYKSMSQVELGDTFS